MEYEGRKFPIAEYFEAPQGEGMWSGTLMLFVRFAGCTVGKPMTPFERTHFGVLNNYQEKCTAWDGAEFACDTNYKATEFMTPAELFDFILMRGLRYVVFTGGEPMMHLQLKPLTAKLRLHGVNTHVETSGTISLIALINEPLPNLTQTVGPIGNLWITLSPKKNYLPENLIWANELKVLIDEHFNEDEFEKQFGPHIRRDGRGGPLMYIQPINDEHTFKMSNVKKCLEIQKRFPQVRLSMQLHKLWGSR